MWLQWSWEHIPSVYPWLKAALVQIKAFDKGEDMWNDWSIKCTAAWRASHRHRWLPHLPVVRDVSYCNLFEEVWLRESVRLKGISWWHHNKSISTRDNKAAPWSTLESSPIHTCPTWATTWCNKISPLLLIQRKARSISRAINAPCWTWHPNYASVLSSIALYYLPSDQHKQTCSQFFAAALRMHHLMHFHSSQHFHAAARPRIRQAGCIRKCLAAIHISSVAKCANSDVNKKRPSS